MRKALIAGWLLLSLFLLLACIATPEKIGEKKPTQKEQPTKQREFKVGDEIKIGDKVLVVAGITRNWQSSSEFMKPTEGKEFVLVGISLANVGDRAVSFSPFDFKIQQSNGVRAMPKPIPAPEEFSPAELAPEGRVTGNLVFEVKAADQPLKLILRSSPFESEVVVNL